MESTFSFNSFIYNLEAELQQRFHQLVTVFNSKGSANIYPDNVSMKKYVPKEKGIPPAQGYISSPYGIRTNPFNSKEKEFHTGLDIAAPKGTFIKASFAGIITATGKSDIAGNYIKISSENGISTMYAHNQFLLVKEGDNVLAGQVIATMGETGMATGPHVHFEFLVDGTRYNPVYAIEI
ncbi:MAG: M23 family metallopeptidase [Oscillospiraceae bacterium]|nr:M23 family metallopeptidase [Oscillospiraceae bacterium]